MYILSCEPATCAIPEWHKEHFRGLEEIITSEEGWAPGSLNLAQAFATKLRALLAHGDVTRLLVDLSKHPSDPARFSRYSQTLTPDQKQKLDDRHLGNFHNALSQRITAAMQHGGPALHLSLRTSSGMDADVEFRHSGGREIEAMIAKQWATGLRSALPEVVVKVVTDDSYGLSAYLREMNPGNFGSISVVVTATSFLDGKPVRWDQLKKHLLATLPPVA